MPFESCTLCPRTCNANRIAGALGYCTQNVAVKLARAALHQWEEPPISGWKGSGTVFFSGCPLHCVYCQNQPISTGAVGKEVSIERLAEIFLEQAGRGAHNINLVTPTQFTPQICQALDIARDQGLKLPVVYNCGGYESVETIESLKGYVDIFLTDFKYAGSRIAARYSHADDYQEKASAALDAMYKLVGSCLYDSDGMMQHGIIVRHLLLPGQVFDSFAVMRLLHEKPYWNEIRLSLMSQYTPMEGIGEHFPELAAPVDPEDYDSLVNYALGLGFEDIFTQEGSAASESFIPAFDYEGV